jgi:hypothetical protein
MARTIQQVKDQIFGNSAGRSHANYAYPGSMFDSLATDIANVLTQVESKYENIIDTMKIDSASGSNLEYLVRDLNIERKLGSRANTLASDSNLVISTTSGQTVLEVFNEYGLTTDNLIICNAGKSKLYSVYSPTIPSNTPEMYVSARALTSGLAGNARRNELSFFTTLYPKLKVTNRFAINNGKDSEDDTSLRNRALTVVDTNLKNQNGLNSVLRYMVPDYGRSTVALTGPGSYCIYLQPSTDLLYPESVLNDVSSMIKSFLPAGQKVIIKNFDPVVFTIETRFIFSSNSNVNSANTLDQIKNVIQNYFDNLTGGSAVSLLELEALIGQAVSAVKLISREGNHFKRVTYAVTDGSAIFNYVAIPGQTLFFEQNQIPTIRSVDISLSSE